MAIMYHKTQGMDLMCGLDAANAIYLREKWAANQFDGLAREADQKERDLGLVLASAAPESSSSREFGPSDNFDDSGKNSGHYNLQVIQAALETDGLTTEGIMDSNGGRKLFDAKHFAYLFNVRGNPLAHFYTVRKHPTLDTYFNLDGALEGPEEVDDLDAFVDDAAARGVTVLGVVGDDPAEGAPADTPRPQEVIAEPEEVIAEPQEVIAEPEEDDDKAPQSPNRDFLQTIAISQQIAVFCTKSRFLATRNHDSGQITISGKTNNRDCLQIPPARPPGWPAWPRLACGMG
jgi:hypothetical protein